MKNMSRIVTILIVLISFSAFSQPVYKVVGYLQNWYGNTTMMNFARNFDYKRVTHINLAFKNPDASGNLEAFTAKEDTLVKHAHANGVQVFMSIAGGGVSGNSSWIARYDDLMSESKRTGFVHKLTQYVLDHNLDGMDVDLEGEAIDLVLYPPFIEELHDSLKSHGKQITAALSQGYGGQNVDPFTFNFFDWINIMAYDQYGSWSANPGGNHSSYPFAVNNINFWKNRGLPKSKCVLGVPFYGYGFMDDRNGGSYLYKDLILSHPDAIEDDTVGSFIYHNGIPTIEKKTILAMNQAAGIMIWELMYDAPGDNSLLKAIYETGILSKEDPVLEDDRVSVFPVPTQDILNIESDLRTYHITLSAMDGTEVRTGKNLSSISLNGLPKGIYLLTISAEEGKLHKKVVVQ